jgi:hypothetical protein
MVNFEEYMKQAIDPERAAGSAAPGAAPLPKGLEQIMSRVIPMVEKSTGKSVDELIMGGMKAAAMGKAEDYLKNLIPGMGGSDTPPISKKPSDFAYYLKSGAIWIPLFILFIGTVIIALIGLFRYMIGVTG